MTAETRDPGRRRGVEGELVVPVVVEPDPPATIDRDKLAEAADRGKLNPDQGEGEGTR